MKNNVENNITLKIKYSYNNDVYKYIKNYNSIFNIVYNYVFENKKASTKEIMNMLNSKNNLFLDTYFKLGAIYDNKAETNKENKIIFGGKKLFLNRIKNLISKEEFQKQKLRPLCVVGASYNKGNAKFQIISDKEILFKPSKNEHFILNLSSVGKNYQNYLKALISAQNKKLLPITYKLDFNYIYITFDVNKIKEEKQTKKIKDRIFAIDMNPNYIGWSVIQWKNSEKYHLIKSGVISLKSLNDYDNSLKGKGFSVESKERKYITNKRKYEVIEIAHTLCKLANHFKCEIFSLEDLNIKSSDKEKGRKFNKLCNNQWNRNILIHIINKQCSLYNIYVQKVIASYSSFQGNLIYREEKLPDMILSSIEISRRGYEFYHQYIIKDIIKKKNIIFNDSKKSYEKVSKSLEEFGISVDFKNLKDLYYILKKMKCSYRFPLEKSVNIFLMDFKRSIFRKFYMKSFQEYYIFT